MSTQVPGLCSCHVSLSVSLSIFNRLNGVPGIRRLPCSPGTSTHGETGDPGWPPWLEIFGAMSTSAPSQIESTPQQWPVEQILLVCGTTCWSPLRRHRFASLSEVNWCATGPFRWGCTSLSFVIQFVSFSLRSSLSSVSISVMCFESVLRKIMSCTILPSEERRLFSNFIWYFSSFDKWVFSKDFFNMTPEFWSPISDESVMLKPSSLQR